MIQSFFLKLFRRLLILFFLWLITFSAIAQTWSEKRYFVFSTNDFHTTARLIEHFQNQYAIVETANVVKQDSGKFKTNRRTTLAFDCRYPYRIAILTISVNTAGPNERDNFVDGIIGGLPSPFDIRKLNYSTLREFQNDLNKSQSETEIQALSSIPDKNEVLAKFGCEGAKDPEKLADIAQNLLRTAGIEGFKSLSCTLQALKYDRSIDSSKPPSQRRVGFSDNPIALNIGEMWITNRSVNSDKIIAWSGSDFRFEIDRRTGKAYDISKEFGIMSRGECDVYSEIRRF